MNKSIGKKKPAPFLKLHTVFETSVVAVDRIIMRVLRLCWLVKWTLLTSSIQGFLPCTIK